MWLQWEAVEDLHGTSQNLKQVAWEHQQYVVSSDQWTYLNSVPTHRYSTDHVVADGTDIYVLGGRGTYDINVFSTVEVYATSCVQFRVHV